MNWITYVPEFEENRLKPEDQQITVELLPLSVRESKKLATSVTAKRVKGGGFKTNQSELTLSMLRNHIRNIQNLEWAGQPVTSAEDLFETPYVDLAGELEEAISSASQLSEGEVKNLRSQSTGSPEMRDNGGDATSAENNNPR